jgi:outer membrane protein TolC
MKKFAFVPVAFALVASLASQAICAPLTLKDCIAEAIKHSPGLSAYRHLIAADKADVTKTRGTTLPYLSSRLEGYEVNGFPTTQWSPLGINQPELGLVGLGPLRNQNAHWSPVGVEEIGVTYPLYYEGSILGLNDPPAVASARNVVTEQEFSSQIAEQKVIFDVAGAFVNAASYHDQLRMYEQIVKLDEKQLTIVQAQVKLGLKLPQEVDVYRAQLEAAREAEDSSRLNMQNFSQQLAALMGHTIDGESERLELDYSKMPLPPLPGLREFLDHVMPNHPALRVQQAKVEVARQQLRVDQAGILPTVTLNTSFTGAQDFDYFNGSGAHRRTTMFLSYLTIDVPLWDFGQRRAATSESQEKVLYEKDTAAQLALDIRTSIIQAYGKIKELAQTVAERHSTSEKDKLALALATAQRQKGLIDEFTLTAAEVTALTAEASLEAEALLERLEYVDLQNLAGGNWQWMP